jgi:hypothetical protein
MRPYVAQRELGEGRGIIAGMVGSAYLKVFLPVEALSERERIRAERAIVQGENDALLRRVYRERGSGRFGLLTADRDGADVRSVDGRWYVCPWRTSLRILTGLLQVRETIPREVAEALVPEQEARRAARELDRARRRDPAAVPALLESGWHVPVRWFVLFEDHERRLTEGPAEGFRLSYWTGLPAARRRARRAAVALDGGGLDAVGEIVRELDEWLGTFDPRGAVELDYGDVAMGAGWNDLDEDHSAGEIQQALDALEAGDLHRAGELYQGVAGRWAEAKLRESFN